MMHLLQQMLSCFIWHIKLHRNLGFRWPIHHSNCLTHDFPGNWTRRERDAFYCSVTVPSPICSLIRRATSGFKPSPVLPKTKLAFSSDQSSLKLVESAEIQIWRTGALGEITNFAGGSSKLMCNAPAFSSTSNSASPSAA